MPEKKTVQETIPAPPVYRDPYENEPDLREHFEKSGRYGVMYAPDYDWDAPKCVAEAYGDSKGYSPYGRVRRSLEFHTGWLTPERAAECIDQIPTYRSFEPPLVRDAIASDRTPENMHVVVGREKSPVLYFWTKDPVSVATSLRAINAKDADPSDVHPPSGPDELGAITDATEYPVGVVGTPIGELSGADPGWCLLRAWWD